MLMTHRRKGAAREFDRDRLTWCSSERAAESACRRRAARRLHRRRRRRAEEPAEPAPPSGLETAQLRFKAPLLNKASAICSGVPSMTISSSISSRVGSWFSSSYLLWASILARRPVFSEFLSPLCDATAVTLQRKKLHHTIICVKHVLYMLMSRRTHLGIPLSGRPLRAPTSLLSAELHCGIPMQWSGTRRGAAPRVRRMGGPPSLPGCANGRAPCAGRTDRRRDTAER